MSNKLTTKENTMQIIKFVLFSISAGVIQMVSFTLLNELIKWDYWPSYLIALTLSVLWNFTLNREFTFKSANNIPLAMLKVAIFYAVFTPLSTLWGQALANASWNEYLVLFFTMVINMVTEFLYCRYFVYGKSINTNKRAIKSLDVNNQNKTTDTAVLVENNSDNNEATSIDETSVFDNENNKTNIVTENIKNN